MRQATAPTSFSDIAKQAGGEMPAGWSKISGPPPALVDAIAQLLSGRLPLTFMSYGGTRSLILQTPKAAFILRTPGDLIFSTHNAPWDPEAITLYVAALILKPGAFQNAYATLAAAKAAGNRVGAQAAMLALCALISAHPGFSEPLVYFYGVRGTEDVIAELDSRFAPPDAGPVAIGKLFLPATFPDYVLGKIFPKVRVR